MKSHYSNKKVSTLLLAFFVLFGIGTIASTTVQAQYPGDYGQYRRDRDRDYRRDRDRDRDDRYDDRYRRNGRYDNYNQYEVARQQGYNAGLNVGASDAQRGQNYDPQRSHYWKNGDSGYSGYGNRGQYKQAFRDAFVQGYREGYSRYGYNRRGNNGRWGNGRWGSIWPR
ncbi:MAG: hypothetical protein C5B55_14085 [Blastocatellia bacterium]|nr:MAG: hypothetical protein C5B55_14085 [Blastocatellia bacterium]